VMLHKDDLHVVYTSTDIVQGAGGAQVLAITNTVPPQATSAGGWGRWWWGSSCDIVNGHELKNCARTPDSTVCMGADGRTMYNNQRFEFPQGVARYNLPFPSTAQPYHSDYISWPWWIRSDVGGAVYAYSGSTLTKYAKDMSTVWRVITYSGMGLMLTDDETTVVMSNSSHLWSLSTSTGMQNQLYTYSDFGATSCDTVVSPWTNPTPVPMSDSRSVVLSCADSTGAYFVKVANLQTGRVQDGTISLNVIPAEAIVDSSFNFYAIGTVHDTPTVQRVNMKAMSS